MTDIESPHGYPQYRRHPDVEMYHPMAIDASIPIPHYASWQHMHFIHNNDQFVPVYGGYLRFIPFYIYKGVAISFDSIRRSPSSIQTASMDSSLNTGPIQTYTSPHPHVFSAIPSITSSTLGHAEVFPNTTVELPPAMALPSAPTTSYPMHMGPSPLGNHGTQGLMLAANSDHHLNWEAVLGYTNCPYAMTRSATPSWPGYESCAQSLHHIASPSLPSFSNVDQLTHGLSLPEPQNVTSQYPTSPFPPPQLNPASTSVAVPGEHVPSASHIGAENRPYFGVYHAPPKFFRSPSHRRKGAARAIWFDGRWVDEEELLGGLVTPEGTISVHECRWDEERTPCHLWVTGDKSCMNTHIQKWHGGKPGGDKVETECRWSSCHKRMNKESIARHVVTVHLGEKWWCQGCSDEIARKDAYGRHVARSSNEACRDAGAFVKYDAGGYVIDCRVALDSGGEVRYAL